MSFESLFSKYDRIIFFDIETTGLDPKNCQIIELAAIKLQKGAGGLRWKKADMFVKLPEGKTLPEEITTLTGITDSFLKTNGISEKTAAKAFAGVLLNSRTLLIAHNAQFDLSFIREMFRRVFPAGEVYLNQCDYIDSLTVYKDRRAYPHKLKNAIQEYNLSNEVNNSHHAIGDTYALMKVCQAMDSERNDLDQYINIFGYNPRYGRSGESFRKITYLPQPYHNFITDPDRTLPAIAYEEKRKSENTHLQNCKRRI